MTERENFLETVKFGAPEWVPSGIPSHTIGYLGVNHQGYDDDMDDAHDRPVGSVWTDIWGTVWRKEYPGVMGFPKGYPLADTKNLISFNWPDPDDERLVSRIYKKGHNPDKILAGSHRDTLWEKSYMLVGMENMMTYFYTEPEYVKEVLHHIMDFQLGIAQHYARAGIEMALLGDDLGTQHSLLLSPAIIDEFLIPEYTRLFEFYKQRGIIIWFHSCGHIEPLLEMFIKLGVNILNPVQITANSLENIISVTRGKMALDGGISTKLIIEGSINEIRESVRKTIMFLGKNGGYICGADQGMPFPEENYKAMIDAVNEFGKYPLKHRY